MVSHHKKFEMPRNFFSIQSPVKLKRQVLNHIAPNISELDHASEKAELACLRYGGQGAGYEYVAMLGRSGPATVGRLSCPLIRAVLTKTIKREVGASDPDDMGPQ